jgi:hypothetical protein
MLGGQVQDTSECQHHRTVPYLGRLTLKAAGYRLDTAHLGLPPALNSY